MHAANIHAGEEINKGINNISSSFVVRTLEPISRHYGRREIDSDTKPVNIRGWIKCELAVLLLL